MSRKPETVFRTRVRALLKKLSLEGPLWYEAIQQKSIKGSPDYVLCLGGLFIALELKKSEKDKPDPVQQAKLRQISEACGMSLVAYPENWIHTAELITGLVHEAKQELENESRNRDTQQN